MGSSIDEGANIRLFYKNNCEKGECRRGSILAASCCVNWSVRGRKAAIIWLHEDECDLEPACVPTLNTKSNLT